MPAIGFEQAEPCVWPHELLEFQQSCYDMVLNEQRIQLATCHMLWPEKPARGYL